ncbi:MAG: DNA-binding response regulator [Acidobacteria bacterium]|nr:MAG: DNA-binding response regulator [Acidobacteriota bacterium]REK01499.1 MAG: DNA-binding response regulator [Acidobacteriota bacterium]REK14455.1 MAG: DNA-binding response regulator [Acidobacteriota bacterium]REK45170.1 MAG: DNA-binding response regulator [Acidobacteriota bacterium]
MTTSIIKIFLIGDYSIFRNALRMLIETDERLRIVGEGDDLRSASKTVAAESPDLVLVDLPDSQVHKTLNQLKGFDPPVLVLINKCDVETYKMCLQIGISGLILKEEPADTLFKAVEKIYDGELWFDRAMMGETIRDLMERKHERSESDVQDPADSLTDREREVVELICAGKRTKDIAEDLFIAENTVRHHLTAIFNKLETKGRLELVIYAFKNGLAKLPNENGGSNGNGRSRTINA